MEPDSGCATVDFFCNATVLIFLTGLELHGVVFTSIGIFVIFFRTSFHFFTDLNLLGLDAPYDTTILGPTATGKLIFTAGMDGSVVLLARGSSSTFVRIQLISIFFTNVTIFRRLMKEQHWAGAVTGVDFMEVVDGKRIADGSTGSRWEVSGR